MDAGTQPELNELAVTGHAKTRSALARRPLHGLRSTGPAVTSSLPAAAISYGMRSDSITSRAETHSFPETGREPPCP